MDSSDGQKVLYLYTSQDAAGVMDVIQHGERYQFVCRKPLISKVESSYIVLSSQSSSTARPPAIGGNSLGLTSLEDVYAGIR